MNSKPGDLVGIPLPYTDLTAKKRRPVLVMTNPDGRGDEEPM
jgi:mRNA interferase MazF